MAEPKSIEIRLGEMIISGAVSPQIADEIGKLVSDAIKRGARNERDRLLNRLRELASGESTVVAPSLRRIVDVLEKEQGDV